MVPDQDIALHHREEIDCLADRFEREFRAGSNPRIEDYLQRQPELRRYLLRELLALEVELQQQVGHKSSAEDYDRRFPGDGDIVADVLAPETGKTIDYQRNMDDDRLEPLPEHLGRYAIRRVLGRGGFGVVYLAHDPQLDRLVALKVPRRKRFQTPEQVASFIAEARTAASLKHASLVGVYDVQEHDGLPYIVQEYIEGQNLRDWSAAKRPSFEQIARVLVGVAEALGYVHQQGLTHCDLKLANVLMSTSGLPHVADFGLAVHVSIQALRKGEVFGTPAMMAPEQVRGESHRLDGRTDIWALGVMLYELLVGRRPFTGESRDDVYAEILTHDPKPPRQIDRKVPRELERICLKCLSKRRTERYNTTDDLRADLSAWLGNEPSMVFPSSTTVATAVPRDSSSSPQPTVKIVPKGLRSFDAEDADFFLELLPGPRDRFGLPDSIRFWKSRIEETDPDETFSVGLIYGPSGCGKSSLVKAGLLPRLCEDVLPIYVEAAASDTEVRILKQLKQHFSQLNPGIDSLPEVLAELRLTGVGRDRKILIVLDQFEQWLHAHGGDHSSQLIDALRQCDGLSVQCIVMVRDDFWMAATRFMRELEVRLLEGVNSGSVDLFDQDHARKVLADFGRAYGRLSEELTAEQEEFLEQSIKGLAQEGKIVCVRLSLFADMMKGRRWTPATLQHVGGTEGIGVTFLEATFRASTAPPEHRLHQKAARAVLQALLPGAGTNIKGYMRSCESLLDASGYAACPQEFVELIRILDSEVRLITPTDPEGIDSESELHPEVDSGQKYYQLTHDYLVPSLRAWLKKQQEESREGRAELRLAELADWWRGENRHLPSWIEYLSIRMFTKGAKWKENERAMMDAARSYYGIRWSGAIAAILLVAFTIQQIVSAEQRRSRLRVMTAAVDTLQNSRGTVIRNSLSDLDRLPREPLLKELHARYLVTEGERKLPLAYGLARLGSVDVGFLTSQIVSAADRECSNIVSALDSARRDARILIESRILEAEERADWQAKSRLAIVNSYLGYPDTITGMLSIDTRDPIQRTILIDVFPRWNAGLDVLADLLETTASPSLRSGICLAIGSLGQAADIDTKRRWNAILAECYLNQPDTGTHGAADWALRQWGLPQPKAYLRRADKEFDWLVTPNDLTMVRIPAGTLTLKRDGEDAEREIGVTNDYLISDREISTGLFRTFLNDDGPKPTDWEGADRYVSTTDAHPVQRASWVDAVQFCNWLSTKEGLVPCYRSLEGERGGQVWKFVDGTNGYSLPTEVQWEYACRAGTATRFSSGDADSLVGNYAVFRREEHTQVCGTKMCNGWGLFDMHGNVWEWCCDRTDVFVPTSKNDASTTNCGMRGGCFGNRAIGIRSSQRDTHPCTHRSSALGFRVVRHLGASGAAGVDTATNAAAAGESLP